MVAGVKILLKRANSFKDDKGKYDSKITNWLLDYGEPLYLVAEDALIIGDGKHTALELYNDKEYFAKVKDPSLYDVDIYNADLFGQVKYYHVKSGDPLDLDHVTSIPIEQNDELVANTEFVHAVVDDLGGDLEDKKMDKLNPTGTGSLSINRKASTTVGTNSVAVGTDNTASADSAFAEGKNSVAAGVASHTEGLGTIANGANQHVQGKYNIANTNDFADIIGNGTADDKRSNAAAITWAGDAYYTKDVYVDANFANSPVSGTRLIKEPVMANAYASGTTYKKGQIVFYNGKLYRCLADNTTAAPTDTSKWTEWTLSNIADDIDSKDNSGNIATTKFVQSVVTGNLDGLDYASGDQAASKTVKSITQENGKVSAVWQNIAITYDQVSDGTANSKPLPATASPKMDGTAAVGTATKYAREDHVHPSDSKKANLASPTFTGTPAAPTAAAGTNSTQIATTAFVKTAIDNNNKSYNPYIYFTAAEPTSYSAADFAKQINNTYPANTTKRFIIDKERRLWFSTGSEWKLVAATWGME